MAKLTMIEMANILSQLCIAKDAQISGIKPNKAQLFHTINSAYKDICHRHADFTFLNVYDIVRGYTLGDAVEEVNIAVDSTDTNRVGNVPNQTDYISSQITLNQDTEVTSMGIHIDSGYVAGAGIHNSTVSLMLCNVNTAGEPDVTKPITTSQEATLLQRSLVPYIDATYADGTTGQISAGTEFELTVDDPIGVKAGNYAVVLKVVASATSSDSIYSAGATSAIKGKYKKGSGAWTDSTSYLYTVYINGYEALLTSLITIPNSFEKIFNMVGDNNTLLGESSNQQDGQSPYTDKFYPVGYNSDGSFTVRVHDSVATTLNWTVYGKANALDMTLDADVPLTPLGYEKLIIDKSLLECVDMNWVISSPINTNDIKERVKEREYTLRRDYRPDVTLTRGIDRMGFTPNHSSLNYSPLHPKIQKGLNR